jgi:hypothetical protein
MSNEPAAWTAATQDKKFPWGKVLIGCGIGCGAVVVLGVIALAAGLVFLLSGPEGGVRTAGEMEEYATQDLERRHLLQPGEKLVVYYDASLNNDATEAAILTNKRVITYYQNNPPQAVALADIEEIVHYEDFGDIIEITAKDGTLMKVEIAVLNDGPTFIRALRAEWDRATGKDNSAAFHEISPPADEA